MAATYSVYNIKFIGTPNIDFNDVSGTVHGAKIDTIIDSAPLSIRENIEEVALSDISVSTADGNFMPTTISLVGKLWHTTSAKTVVNAVKNLRSMCFGITVPGNLNIYWQPANDHTIIGKINHCLSFDWHGTDGMRQVEFEVVFTVIEPGT